MERVRLELGSPPQDASFTNPPQIAGQGRSLLAVWTSSGIGYKGRGLLSAVFSSAAGRSWKEVPRPGDWPDEIDQGFHDLAADAAGGVHLVWLDARKGQKGLHYARFHAETETWSSAVTVDPRTCECCSNRLLVDRDQIYLL